MAHGGLGLLDEGIERLSQSLGLGWLRAKLRAGPLPKH